ncbi:MAG: DUF1449 family protein [Flammeovirgaceae bacterium]|nr:DUF1449 family protein [Flammeovirgaceae bacterium]
MMEFLQAAFLPVNIPYTGRMVLTMLYWFTVIIGVFDVSSFDIDLDVDVDIDMDAEVDSGNFGIGQVLHFFNFGEVPFMIIFSFLSLFMWVASIMANYYLGNSSWPIALGLFIPIFISCLFLTKFVTYPFVKFFHLAEKVEDTNVLGKICDIIMKADTSMLGQAEVKTQQATQLINIKATANNTLEKGAKGLVLEYNDEKNFYLVEPYS